MKERQRTRVAPERDNRSGGDGYLAEWQRKSKEQIVESAISALKEDIKRAVARKPRAA